MANYHKIDFHLKRDNRPEEINFLPYGTRTLKIRTKRYEDDPKIYILRSSHVPRDFGDDQFYSHEEGSSNFRLSWGGGRRRKGACLAAEDSVKIGGHGLLQDCVAMTADSSYTYLNLTHLSGPIDKSYDLLLGAYLSDGDDDDPPVYSTLIRLTPPLQIANGTVQQPLRHNKDLGKSMFEGKHAPIYLARWWSPEEVSYEPVQTVPDLRITADDNLLSIHLNGRTTPLVTIQDNVKMQKILQSRTFDAELFRWDQYYVLRLWFAWLETHGLKTVMDEIPDAERFDFVIDVENKFVVYAATDLHWREVWVPGPDNPADTIKAGIGLFNSTAVKSLPDVTDVIEEAKEYEKEAGSHGPRIPTDTVVPGGSLEKGIFEAHVPYFQDLEPEGVEFISSDPREG